MMMKARQNLAKRHLVTHKTQKRKEMETHACIIAFDASDAHHAH
jgi:hypothetical protein